MTIDERGPPPHPPNGTATGQRSLVGRDTEMAAVGRALRERAAVVVAGAAGVGKSRLARELAARSTRDGRVGVVMASRSAAEVPLAALAPLWPDGEVPGGEALNDHAADTPAHGPDVGVFGRAVATVLAHDVVLVDDAHHLDPVSAAVLRQAAARQRTRLILTVRTGARSPDAVTSLWKDGPAERIELFPLSRDDTAALAEVVLGGPADAAARQRLFSITDGNPLWLHHLVDGERAAGRLTVLDGMWRWQGRPELSTALEELLAERIGALTEAERHVLELLALGEPLGLGTLEALVDAHAVENTAQRELITVRSEGVRSEARLAHPLYGEAVRARMSPPRLRRVRGELVDALAATGQRRAGDQLRRAVLGLDSDRRTDPDLMCSAAMQAIELGDVELGERLFRTARDAGAGFEAQIGLGHLEMWRMRGEQADAELAHAAAAARTDAERARAVVSRAQNMLFMLAMPVEAAALIDAAIEADGRPDASDLLGIRAVLHATGDELAAGTALVERVLAAPEASAVARAYAGWAQVIVGAHSGCGAPLGEAADAALIATRASPDTVAFGPNIEFVETFGLGLEGRLVAACAVADRMRAREGQVAAGFAAFFDGRIALERGRVRTAHALLTEIRPFFPGRGGGWGHWIEIMIATTAAMAGDTGAATEALHRAREVQHPGMVVLAPQALWASAWVSASRGAVAEALAHLGRAADLAASSGQYAIEVVVRHTAVCFGDRSQVGPLAALARRLGTPRAHAAATHARVWTERDPAALDAVSRTLEELGLDLVAADAAAQASVQHATAGTLSAASASSARAAALAERCERPRTPALIASTSPVVVSSREREVATLAARGMSNREIADHMHVSLRTVQSHIYRACSRLGLSGRDEFAATVVPADAPSRER